MNVIFRRVFLVLAISVIVIGTSPDSIASKENERPTLSFGFIPIYTPYLMYERFQPLMDYLSRTTPYRFKMRLTKDYKDIINLLKDGTIDIALLGGVSYVAAREEIDLIPILKPLNPQGKPFYRNIIVTRADRDDINSLPDLKGKSVAFGARWSTSTSIVPLYHLYKSGIGLNDLSTYFHLRYSDSVAREVLKGNYDAGAIMDTMAHFYEDKGLKFIFISESIPALPIVVRKDAPEEFINGVKKALLSINPADPGHRDMLREWGEEIKYGFAEAKDSDYNGLRRMIEYLKGKGVYFRINED